MNFGRQWTPDPKDIHVLHITKYSHGKSRNMLNKNITKNNITSYSQLFFATRKYLETKRKKIKNRVTIISVTTYTYIIQIIKSITSED
ncbi:hypothetical protein [Aquimarina muelleri]|uniref:Uncharacterized protein n=1 Tax=Aquimarina muelleri TaxID=279356 RepID=A0A918JYD4_9FLAO|nr:hypothetical protein [Aquimarina muelleri]MCX2764762.1 hypothetical protein [Aquimarina muelleri]GGX33729.1 hypothetical protein GCM10007384_38010 [Aquimarina muelleri]